MRLPAALVRQPKNKQEIFRQIVVKTIFSSIEKKENNNKQTNKQENNNKHFSVMKLPAAAHILKTNKKIPMNHEKIPEN